MEQLIDTVHLISPVKFSFAKVVSKRILCYSIVRARADQSCEAREARYQQAAAAVLFEIATKY